VLQCVAVCCSVLQCVVGSRMAARMKNLCVLLQSESSASECACVRVCERVYVCVCMCV